MFLFVIVYLHLPFSFYISPNDCNKTRDLCHRDLKSKYFGRVKETKIELGQTERKEIERCLRTENSSGKKDETALMSRIYKSFVN